MRLRRVSLPGAALAIVLSASACTPDPPVEPTVAATTPPPPSAAVASPSGERPPPGRWSIEIFTEQSRVTVAGTGVGPSSVEVRIEQLLTELDAADTPEGSLVTLPEEVLFDFDSDQLKPEASTALDQLAEAIVLAADRRVSIRGHTDGRGADDYNQGLSERRAAAVRDYLVQRHGVDPARLESVGFGETQPVAPNEAPDGSDDPAGRQRNRRVEVVLENAPPP